MEDTTKLKKRSRSDESPAPETDIFSPEVKKLRQDLLDFDDDSEFCTGNQDLDSFMKSFQDEISAGDTPAPAPVPESLISGEPDLGYLLEASDDDLGLPPTVPAGGELVRVDSDESEFRSEFWEAQPSYDSFGFGVFEETDNFGGAVGNSSEYVAIDGLFDFGSGDFSWRPETLPAL